MPDGALDVEANTKKLGLILAVAACCNTPTACLGADLTQAAVDRCLAQFRDSPLPVQVPDMSGIIERCLEDLTPCRTEECAETEGERVCDEKRIIANEAAVCIAQSAGLKAEASSIETELNYSRSYRRVFWSVKSVDYDRSTPGNVDRGGLLWNIDAVSGALLAEYGWHERT